MGSIHPSTRFPALSTASCTTHWSGCGRSIRRSDRADGSYDQDLVLSKVWYKQQDRIAAGDLVVSYDKQGRLQPGPVTRTMQNNATHILDFWGTGVTPGHAYYCADGKFKGQHVPLMDILRAATNCDVGSIGDRTIHAEASVKKPDGTWTPKKRGQSRFGTRISTPDGKKSVSVMEIAERQGWSLSEDGYTVGKMKGEDGTVQEGKFPFPYTQWRRPTEARGLYPHLLGCDA